ncbi:phytanoyl-CoA dioxygenase, peroxisomal-like [Haliotis rubra]|uniref:phytanoyl-CoA dioxygenase, peroxisomal-like n=1 Tax=Haliotis rubra TaxID=36100 RepID=UPI001EE53F03|nr:phytanoyl-CoA dioxygenase, peroxisomal-like [Haliotis rubra]
MAGPKDTHSVIWPSGPSPMEWIKTKPTAMWRDSFREDGYLVVKDLLTKEELQIYQDICTKMLQGDIDTATHRHDLGNVAEQKQPHIENICQILWPSMYVRHLDEGPVHRRVLAIAHCLLGEDIVFDHDMILAKAPFTDTTTPWHQDESYWPVVADKRALMCWTALDNAVKDNGCMWFGRGSHKGMLRVHTPVKEGCHLLSCETYESDDMVCVEIPAGSCTFHHARTLHYTRGNATNQMRRAIVTSYRPAAMLKEFQNVGHDHGKRGLKSVLLTGQTHGWQDKI